MGSWLTRMITHGTTVIWLFQMTVAARHPINSKGIEKLVADLVDQGGRGKPERPRHIKLIFVVPADAEKFKAQKIRVIPAGSEVKQLARLDTFTKPDLSKLRGRSIETVADLIAEMDKDPDLERFRHLLPTDCIEQFVLRMPDSWFRHSILVFIGISSYPYDCHTHFASCSLSFPLD